IIKANICGCPENEIVEGDMCISIFRTGPELRTFSYVLRGDKKSFSIIVYKGLKDHLAGISRWYTCNPDCPTDKEIYLGYLNEEEQKKELGKLVDAIRAQTDNKDDQARIAISIVQQIPYDWEGFRSGDIRGRYPYEVIFDNKGVCGEKSPLLAFLLRDLGFGVVLFNYEKEQHMAVGIKCPTNYSFLGIGYCFVEAAAPTIITDYQSDYVGVGKLWSTPTVIEISDGISFDSVSDEFNDARTFISIDEQSKATGGFVDLYTYYKWTALVQKYGLETNVTQ
ncbi:MAG: hypothetical protein AB1468_02470, partial [Candidatus Micrarchaeota archaeon]